MTVKLATPKKVSLPNDKTFYEKYKRVCRNARRRRNRQRGCALGKVFKSSFILGTNLAKSRIGKELAKMAIKNVPDFFSKGCQHGVGSGYIYHKLS